MYASIEIDKHYGSCAFAVQLYPSGLLRLCPGDSNIELTCTVANTTAGNVLNWRVSDSSIPDGESKFFTTNNKIDTNHTVGNFTVTLVSTNPLVSIASLKNSFVYEQNGTTLVCSMTTSPSPPESETASSTLTLEGACYLYIQS